VPRSGTDQTITRSTLGNGGGQRRQARQSGPTLGGAIGGINTSATVLPRAAAGSIRQSPRPLPSSFSACWLTPPRYQPIEPLLAHPCRRPVLAWPYRPCLDREAGDRILPTAHGRLTAQNPVAPGLAEVEGHHFRHVEQRHTIRPGGVQPLLIQPQRYASRPAHFHERDQIGQRPSNPVDTEYQYLPDTARPYDVQQCHFAGPPIRLHCGRTVDENNDDLPGRSCATA
jgi:hypothetical protein